METPPPPFERDPRFEEAISVIIYQFFLQLTAYHLVQSFAKMKWLQKNNFIVNWPQFLTLFLKGNNNFNWFNIANDKFEISENYFKHINQQSFQNPLSTLIKILRAFVSCKKIENPDATDSWTLLFTFVNQILDSEYIKKN